MKRKTNASKQALIKDKSTPEINFLEALRVSLYGNNTVEIGLDELGTRFIAADINSLNDFYLIIGHKELILTAYILDTDIKSLRKALTFPLDKAIVFAITEDTIARLDNLLNQCPLGNKGLLLYALGAEPVNQQVAYVNLPAPDVWDEDLYFSDKEEVKAARKHYQWFVDFYGIKVKKPEVVGTGACEYFATTIYVPRINTKADFVLCLHEVGHILHGNTLMDLRDEYKADEFALKQAKEFGLDTTAYEMHAKRCLFAYAQKEHQSGRVWMELEDIEWTILTDWLGITEEMWSAERLELLP